MSADLHCHSRFSDGAMEIPQLLKLARQAGLDHLAITDHETFHGYDYAAELAAGYGLKIIKGIELSARDPANGRSVHVLCYLPRDTAEIEALCERTRRARMKAGFVMARRLCALYPQLTLEEIFARSYDSECLYKPHMMQALQQKGVAEDARYGGPLFHQLFDPGTGSCFEPIDYPSVYEVLEIARRSGGWVVLAHPSVYRSMELAEALCREGAVDGLEIDHPRNTEADKARLRQLAAEYGLLVTGGTDFHGHAPQKDNPLGTGNTSGDQLEIILKGKKERL